MALCGACWARVGERRARGIRGDASRTPGRGPRRPACGMLPAMPEPRPRPAEDLVTVGSLRGDLARLGIEPGMVVIAHVSLSALGWVAGGEPAVIAALRAALGEDGTLVM